MSKLLLNEEPLLIMPMLATKIGLNESIVLQQIHYWLQINKKANNNFRDGYYWTFNSYDKWQAQFPFWSIPTIQRTILKLEKKKLVVVGNYNKMKIDRTKWYRIDYEVLESIENEPIHQNDVTNTSNRYDEHINLISPIPETNTETNTETNSIEGISSENSSLPYPEYILSLLQEKDCNKKQDILQTMLYYDGKYIEVTKEEPVRYTKNTLIKAFYKLEDIFQNGIYDDIHKDYLNIESFEYLQPLIDRHFEVKYKNMDYKLMAFLQDKVLTNRYHEIY